MYCPIGEAMHQHCGNDCKPCHDRYGVPTSNQDRQEEIANALYLKLTRIENKLDFLISALPECQTCGHAKYKGACHNLSCPKYDGPKLDS